MSRLYGVCAMEEPPETLRARLRSAVCRAYSAAAEEPGRKHAFPVGRAFAESLGYPPALLAALPVEAVDAFAGVSCLAVLADVPPGAAVLDLGCGSGLDALVAGQRVGPRGRVVGLDFSLAMLGRARRAASAAGFRPLLAAADAERLPLADACIDLAMVNGIFNLNPARAAIFGELARVVKPGGTVFAAELILCEPRPPREPVTEDDWFA